MSKEKFVSSNSFKCQLHVIDKPVSFQSQKSIREVDIVFNTN